LLLHHFQVIVVVLGEPEDGAVADLPQLAAELPIVAAGVVAVRIRLLASRSLRDGRALLVEPCLDAAGHGLLPVVGGC
jgi:hypothetical protein